jgi:hypothetical protein
METFPLTKRVYTLAEKASIEEAIKSELPEATHLMIRYHGGTAVYVFGEHPNENYADAFADQWGVENTTEASSWVTGADDVALYQFSVWFNADKKPEMVISKYSTGDIVGVSGHEERFAVIEMGLPNNQVYVQQVNNAVLYKYAVTRLIDAPKSMLLNAELEAMVIKRNKLIFELREQIETLNELRRKN